MFHYKVHWCVRILEVHVDSYERFSKSADINCSTSKTGGRCSRRFMSGHFLREMGGGGLKILKIETSDAH